MTGRTNDRVLDAEPRCPSRAPVHGATGPPLHLDENLGAPVYFCDPASRWQLGTNGNIKRLLRQYFPKGTDLGLHSPERLTKAADGTLNCVATTVEVRRRHSGSVFGRHRQRCGNSEA